MAISITIPLSRWKQFGRVQANGQRMGQQFYEFMQLHKITDADNKVWCDTLYNASDKAARQMILASVDQTN